MQLLLVGFLLLSFLSSSSIAWWQMLLMTIGGLVALLYALYKYQENLLFQPVIMGLTIPERNPPEYKNPLERKMPYEDVTFDTDDGERLSGWFIPVNTNILNPSCINAARGTQGVATILYFHANAGNMGFRLPFLEKLHQSTACNIFIISYRGYGKSSGTPTEEGIFRDAEAALKWLRASGKVDIDKILVFGRSLGGAVAINLAAKHQDEIRGVMLENTFTNISAMADKLFPFLFYVKPLVLRMNFPSLESIEKIGVPILFISGGLDEVVPPDHMQTLYDSATKSRRCIILRVPSGMHNDTWIKAGEKYFEVMRDFIRKAVPEAVRMEEAAVVEGEAMPVDSSASAAAASVAAAATAAAANNHDDEDDDIEFID